jgi:hypothetical protein
MKFVSLKSRGGDYLVVAENIAWLRTHEDGQTKVGVVGSDSLLVKGTIEEIAAAILAG